MGKENKADGIPAPFGGEQHRPTDSSTPYKETQTAKPNPWLKPWAQSCGANGKSADMKLSSHQNYPYTIEGHYTSFLEVPASYSQLLKCKTLY